MISIDGHPPPDPSSFDYQNHQQHVSHDLKIDIGEKATALVSDIDLLKNTDGILDGILDDTDNRLPNFSIRNYVFSSRCKDIACNWPFSRESLQLCLDSGVNNLLPPFQSLDSLRSNSSLSNEETINSYDGKSKVDRLVSPSHLENDLVNTKPKKSNLVSSQPAVKKYMKSNTEEVTPNNFIVSETTMASKVCPVCKTFSSSSNTTLNAHIDRCLSEESTMKWTEDSEVIVKHRIKPRKTRLMVDIYKTAPRCTVEDLDRRNGTSWATNSNFPDQELEVEEEKEESQERDFTPEVVGQEGDVYIDTNGTKVRILSMPKVCTSDDHEARTLAKVGKVSKNVMEKKKKKANLQKRHRKFLKLSPNSKKLSSLKPQNDASEARSGQEENDGIETSWKKEDRGEKGKAVEAQVHKQIDDFAITRPPWACSKRSGLGKKFNGKNGKLHSGGVVRNEFQVESDKSSDNISPSQQSKKARTQLSNGSKFASLKTNVLSESSHEHDFGSKINLQRKFSSLKKSHETADTSQDSLKQKSRTEEEEEEEDTSKNSSFDIVNVPEVHKKSSITSKSSNEDSLESAGTEIPSHSNNFQGSFMGLRNSILDDKFSPIESQPDKKFDSQESMENFLIDHNIEDRMNDIEKQEIYFQEVDPIPIPGPPGSSLPPSPGGDVVSEDLQANSSLTTTSRVHSTEDHHHHHDIMNMDFMSESPISTISSPSFARSGNSKPDHDKSSIRFTSQQDTSPLGYTGFMVDAFDKKLLPSSSFKNDQPCCCSRKEGVFSKNVASYPREQVIPRENKRPSSLNFINCPTLPPPAETVKSPVLRLMGKNLTVVNTNDEQFKPPPCSSPMSQQKLHNIQNDQNSFFYAYPSQHPIIFNHNQNGSKPQHFNVYPPNNSRNLTDSRHAHALDTMHYNVHPPNNAPLNGTKEIINIDDTSEKDANDSYAGGVSPSFQNGTFFQTSSPLDGNLGRWGCTQTGSSSVLHPTSLRSPLGFIPNIKTSTSYYPRSFS